MLALPFCLRVIPFTDITLCHFYHLVFLSLYLLSIEAKRRALTSDASVPLPGYVISLIPSCEAACYDG